MKYIECPEENNEKENSVFLAGGISNCEDWQSQMPELLKDTNLVLVNPRRDTFDVSKESETLFQIDWEHRHLNEADAVLFWFPCETLCPITLYELGARCMTNTPVFVGVHPDYARKLDVEVQTKLARPDIKIVYTLEDLAKQVEEYGKTT